MAKELLKTTSKPFNTYIGGFPRGQITLLHVGGNNQDLFRLALMKLFVHPMNYVVKIYDFSGDCASPVAARYKLPSPSMSIETNMRYQTLLPSLVQLVRGPNPPDVVIVNDMDALVRTNPNDYYRLQAIVAPSRTAIIMLSPVATVRDPRKTKFMKILRRLEIALPLTLEAGWGEVVEGNFQFSIETKRSTTGAGNPGQKVMLTLPHEDIPSSERARERIIPSQVIARGKFQDRGVMAQSDHPMGRESYDDGITTQKIQKPGELRNRRQAPPPQVGGSTNLPEDQAQLAQKVAAATAGNPQDIAIAQPGVIEPQKPRYATTTQTTTSPAVPASQPLQKRDVPSLDVDAPTLSIEGIDPDNLPAEVELDEEAEPSFVCVGCQQPYHPSFQSQKITAVVICKYCSKELERPTDTTVPPIAQADARIFCKNCGSPDTKPVSAAQEDRNHNYQVMIRCSACKKSFLHLLTPDQMPTPANAAPTVQRLARGMPIEGDRGTPVMGQQSLAQPGQGVSANAAIAPRRIPTQPIPSNPLEVVEDNKLVREVRGMSVESGDTALEAPATQHALNATPRVNPSLASRMVSGDKTVHAAGIKMRVQVKGDGPAISMGTGVINANALVGSRKQAPGKQGGTREVQ